MVINFSAVAAIAHQTRAETTIEPFEAIIRDRVKTSIYKSSLGDEYRDATFDETQDPRILRTETCREVEDTFSLCVMYYIT